MQIGLSDSTRSTQSTCLGPTGPVKMWTGSNPLVSHECNALGVVVVQKSEKIEAKCFRRVGQYCSPNRTLGAALQGAGAAAAQHSKGGRGSSIGRYLPTRTPRCTQTTADRPHQLHAKVQGPVAQHTQKPTFSRKTPSKNKGKAKCA